MSFCHGGINKLVINPTQPPDIGCYHCGKEFNSFGNIAHHVTHTYPRVIDIVDGSLGKLSKIGNLYTGSCVDAGDSAKINIMTKL